MKKEERETGGGSIQVLGFKRRWWVHKKGALECCCFSDMDLTAVS